MATDVDPTDDELDPVLNAARLRRTELKTAMSALEVACARPIADPEWRPVVRDALSDLECAFQTHVVETEGDDGILTQIVETAPRLANQVAALRKEHIELDERVHGIFKTLSEASASDHDLNPREEILDLLVAVARHRHRGSDLVYETYNIDIGGN